MYIILWYLGWEKRKISSFPLLDILCKVEGSFIPLLSDDILNFVFLTQYRTMSVVC